MQAQAASAKVHVEITLAGILPGHNDLITSIVAGTPQKEGEDSDLLITGSRDRHIIVWRLAPAEADSHPNRHYGSAQKLLRGHNHFVSDLSLSADNTFLLSSSWDKTLRLWDIRSGRSTKLFQGHTQEVFTAAFSPDCRQILSGGADRDIKLWNTLAECKYTFSEKPHTDWVSRLRYSPSAKNAYIASTGWDGFLKIWTTNFQIKYTFRAHDLFINALSIAPNGSYIATGCKGGKVRIWNIQDFSETLKEFEVNGVVHSIAFNPKTQWLAVASESGLRVYDLLDEEDKIIAHVELDGKGNEARRDEVRATKDRRLACTALAWNATGMKLYAAFADKIVRCYHLTHERKA